MSDEYREMITELRELLLCEHYHLVRQREWVAADTVERINALLWSSINDPLPEVRESLRESIAEFRKESPLHRPCPECGSAEGWQGTHESGCRFDPDRYHPVKRGADVR